MIIAYNRDDLDNHLEKMEQETHFDKDTESINSANGYKWIQTDVWKLEVVMD